MPPRRPNIISLLLALLWFTWAARTVRPAEVQTLLDQTFIKGSGADYFVEHALELEDGKVLICGLFNKYNDIPRNWMARLNADGTLDRTFNPWPNGWVRHMNVQPDGKIIIGGQFTEVEGLPRNRIARLNADGTLDRSFEVGTGLEGSLGVAVNGDNSPFIIWGELLDDGSYIGLGNFRTYNGVASSGIVKLKPNGARDTSFNIGSGFDTWTRFVLPVANGQLVVGGWFNSYNGRNFNRLVRLNANGSADTSLNAFYGDRTAVYSIVQQQPSGKLITAGHSLNEQGLFKREIVRLNLDGSVDASWPGKTDEKTECIFQQPDGKMILAGYFTSVNDIWKLCLARLNADGTLDPSFNVWANTFVWNIAPAKDQRILICGGFTRVDGFPVGYVARLNLPERKVTPPPPERPNIVSVRLIEGKVECRVNTQKGFKYRLQYKTEMDANEWSALPEKEGTGEEMALTDEDATGMKFYRVEVR